MINNDISYLLCERKPGNRSPVNYFISRRHESVFDDQDVAAELAEIHEKFVVVPADKASNNIVFVCKTHYINCLMEELGMSTIWKSLV